MTRLEAVNEVLAALGEPPATAVDSTGTWPSLTFGTTLAGQAERFLERASKNIQSRGGTGDAWWPSYLKEYRIRAPLYRFTYSSSDPTTLVFGETFTQATSGATLQFNRVDATNNYIYAGLIAGTVDTTNNYSIVSATSNVTLTITAVTLQTSTTVAVPSSWLKVRSSEREVKNVGARGLYLYEITDDNDGTNPPVSTFTNDIYVDAVAYLDFPDLPHTLANYIWRHAAAEFNHSIKRSREDYQLLTREADMAKMDAIAEDSNARRVNVFHTMDAMMMRGGRQRHGRQNWYSLSQ